MFTINDIYFTREMNSNSFKLLKETSLPKCCFNMKKKENSKLRKLHFQSILPMPISVLNISFFHHLNLCNFAPRLIIIYVIYLDQYIRNSTIDKPNAMFVKYITNYALLLNTHVYHLHTSIHYNDISHIYLLFLSLNFRHAKEYNYSYKLLNFIKKTLNTIDVPLLSIFIKETDKSKLQYDYLTSSSSLNLCELIEPSKVVPDKGVLDSNYFKSINNLLLYSMSDVDNHVFFKTLSREFWNLINLIDEGNDVLEINKYQYKSNNKIKHSIKNHHFIHICVSLSGGVDSMAHLVALCHFTMTMNITTPNLYIIISCVHIQHQNGKDGEEEFKWVKWVISQLNILYFNGLNYIKLFRHNVPIKRPHQGEYETDEYDRNEFEKICQNARYQCYIDVDKIIKNFISNVDIQCKSDLYSLLDQLSTSRLSERHENTTENKITNIKYSNFILIGHHLDDLDENRISEITKGNLTNIDGMSIMSRILKENDNCIYLWRPLLYSIRKSQIIDFATNICHIPFMYDSTPYWSKRGCIRRVIDTNNYTLENKEYTYNADNFNLPPIVYNSLFEKDLHSAGYLSNNIHYILNTSYSFIINDRFLSINFTYDELNKIKGYIDQLHGILSNIEKEYIQCLMNTNSKEELPIPRKLNIDELCVKYHPSSQIILNAIVKSISTSNHKQCVLEILNGRVPSRKSVYQNMVISERKKNVKVFAVLNKVVPTVFYSTGDIGKVVFFYPQKGLKNNDYMRMCV